MINANTTNGSSLWFKVAKYLGDKNLVKPVEAKNINQIGKESFSNDSSITSKHYLSINDVPNIWDALDVNDMFLGKSFLSCIELYAPKGMKFVYWVFLKGEQPIGFAYGQLLRFNTYESVSALHQEVKGNGWQRFQFAVKKFIAQKLNFSGLVIGNLMMTGEHGFYFDKAATANIDIPSLLTHTITETKKQLKSKRVNLHLLKDYFDHTPLDFQKVEAERYQRFAIQPNMIVKIRPEWKNFDDYLQAMSSKYRVRAKRAFKKGKDIEKKELSLDEIDQHNSRIFDLYQNIVKNAPFNTLFLNERYFYGLKEYLKDDFKLIGYFIDNKLIGFYTLLFGQHDVDAHFLGLDNEYNNKHQVYLNMLYDMIRKGIDTGMKEVIMARTALEIKSSVGAEPFGMFVYTKFQNPIINTLLKRFAADWLKPAEWTQRKPFK